MKDQKTEDRGQRTDSALTPAAKDVIEALHDIACAISAAINEFSEPVDKAALRDGLQMIIDVAIAHDLRGNYGIFIGEDSEGGDIG